eukprot:COSAG04_NODE_6061_length_1419_cov_6.236364_2_plen_225_part_01
MEAAKQPAPTATPRLAAATASAGAGRVPQQPAAPTTTPRLPQAAGAELLPPKKILVAAPPSMPRRPAKAGAQTSRAPVAPLAAARAAPSGSLTAREPGLKLGLKLPAHRGEFSDTEQLRKEALLKAAETQCSAIETTGMFVGGEMVARNAALLRSHGITHILNMAGGTIPNFLAAAHGAEFAYMTLYLTDGGDTAGDDFRAALPRVLEWLHSALAPPRSAKVLVH